MRASPFGESPIPDTPSKSPMGVAVNSATALAMIETIRDRAPILQHTNRLAYFVDGDYRASRAWVRAIDWAVLLLLAIADPLWSPSSSFLRIAIASGLQISVLLGACLVFEIASPFLEEF